MAANGSIVTAGPKTASQLAADANEELAELYNRATWLLASVAGTNIITASASAWLTAYADGQRFRFKPAADNTAAVTLNVNSLGAKAVVTSVGAAFVSGSLDADGLYVVTYYAAGDHFRLESAGGSGSGTSTPDALVPFYATGTFDKGDYPGARQFVVTAIGPGGAGGDGNYDAGGGGQAGGVAIKRFVPDNLAASITVTINSSKGEFTHTTPVVGNVGAAGSDETPGSGSGTATGGDLNFSGQAGGDVKTYTDGSTSTDSGGGDGGSPIGTNYGTGGKGGRGAWTGAGPSARNGQNGHGYGGGGGGGGAKVSSGNDGNGGTGAPGAVFVEVRY